MNIEERLDRIEDELAGIQFTLIAARAVITVALTIMVAINLGYI